MTDLILIALGIGIGWYLAKNTKRKMFKVGGRRGRR